MMEIKELECEICGNHVDILKGDWCGTGKYLYHEHCVVQKFHREWRLILNNDS